MNIPDTAIDFVLAWNQRFSETFTGTTLSAPPQRKLLVIACMDARINIETALGLHYGDAHILRNAGGTVTEDVLRSAIVSTNIHGTREIMVINHTGCGMMGCTDDQLHDRIKAKHGQSTEEPAHYHTFTDLPIHVKDQVAILRDHPYIPAETAIRGFIYDVEQGHLNEIDCR